MDATQLPPGAIEALQQSGASGENITAILAQLATMSPEEVSQALAALGVNVDPETIHDTASQWVEENAAKQASAGADGGEITAASDAPAGGDGSADAAAPPADAQAQDPAEEGAEAPGEPDVSAGDEAMNAQAAASPQDMAAAQAGGGAMRSAMPNMDDVVSQSVMQGAEAPTPQIRGGKNIASLKGPATPKVAGGGSAAGPSDYQNTIRNIFRQAQGGGGASKGPRVPGVKGAGRRAQ